MTNFEARKNKGQQLQNQLIAFLSKNQIDFLYSGYERMTGSKNAGKNIKYKNDKTSLFIRHYPDISLISKQSILIEVKNSSGIEKLCYENYISLRNDLGLNVLLFLRNMKLCRIENLKFKKAWPTCPKTKIKIPIIDDVWLSPRLLDKDDYYKYINAYKNTSSGSTFAFIDFDETEFIDLGKLLLLNQQQETP